LLVDYLLARTLQQMGYDRAALNQYSRVIAWLQDPSQSLPQDPELVELLNRPDSLLEDIAELLEKHGDYADAIKALGPSVKAEPDNFVLQSRYARDLASNGQRDAALAKAVDLVLSQRADPESLQTLRTVCRLLNIQDGSVTTLRKLIARRPNDHAVLFALADTLVSRNHPTEAWDLLQNAWIKSPGDVELTRRLFLLDKQQEQIEGAAALLIHALASNSDALSNYVPLWTELLSYSQPYRLRVATLQLMRLDPGDEAARQVWIAVTAEHDSRLVLQQSSLEKATGYTPPFAPAFRSLVQIVAARPDLTVAQKSKSIQDLIATAQNSGDAGLAAELRGLWLADRKEFEQAAAAFREASRLGNSSPELAVAAADVQLSLGQNSKYEQRLWKVIHDCPLYAGAYEALESYYTSPATASPEKAVKVLSTWRSNDPQSTAARLLQAQNAAESGRNTEADQLFGSLFAEDPDYPPVLRELVRFYRQSNRIDELVGKLEETRVSRPRDTALAAQLAELYAGQNRRAEAVRLLDSTRSLVADDADQLYSLVDTYLALDQKQTAEEVLQQVIQLDPTHSGACNGLGFEWADEGKNLPQAETLIRIALAQEPDNIRFLDSLGWVLYKRGDMESARICLEQSVAAMPKPNPVVMDHLGDVLYRLSRRDQALGTWEQSLKELSDDHPDQRKLRLRLLQKIKQAEANQPVDVASIRNAHG
jgi:tetratricopeptide (TPR) repeat protein